MDAAIPQDEVNRLVALHSYNVLDRILQEELEGVVRLSATITGAEKAIVNLVDSDRQWQAAAVGHVPSECTRNESMCAHTILQRDVLHTPDAREDKRFVDNPHVTGELDNVRMYAAAPLITPDGHAIGTICTLDSRAYELAPHQLKALQDLAEQLVTIFELRRRTAALREANEDLDAFAGVVAHDLRNPLTTVNGFAEILESEITNAGPQAEEILGRLRKAASRMTVLVDDVLTYSRSSHSDLRHEDIDLTQVMNEVTENLNSLIDKHSAVVEYDQLGTIHADHSQTVQLFQNLVANAILHNNGTPKIAVATEQHGNRMEITVDDNGPGVPENRRDAVFQAFERNGARVSGQGLGLATCKRIAERHDGQIWIEDSPLGGARFCLSLPQPEQF